MLYVISYDIPHNRRRTQLAKLLEGYGSRVQYSVFECDLTLAQYARLRARIDRLCKPEEDRIRLYRLCAACVASIELIGRGEIETTIDTYII